jgi:hypothetical protein
MLPVAVYGSDTSFSTLCEEYKRRIFEGREKLTKDWTTLLQNEKSQMNTSREYEQHVACIGCMRNAYNFLVRISEGKSEIGRLGCRWVDITTHLTEMGWEGKVKLSL